MKSSPLILLAIFAAGFTFGLIAATVVFVWMPDQIADLVYYGLDT